MKLICSILISCLLCIGQAQALDLKLYDATSFDPQPVVVSAADNSVPTGTVIIWTKEIIPDGWLECNGQPVNATLYPDLHELMSNTPNYQGMFLRGVGSQTVSHGKYGSASHGTSLGAIQGDTIRNITGKWSSRNGGTTGMSGAFTSFSERELHIDSGGIIQSVVQLRIDASLVVPTSEENRPVNVGVKYIIKAE